MYSRCASSGEGTNPNFEQKVAARSSIASTMNRRAPPARWQAALSAQPCTAAPLPSRGRARGWRRQAESSAPLVQDSQADRCDPSATVRSPPPSTSRGRSTPGSDAWRQTLLPRRRARTRGSASRAGSVSRSGGSSMAPWPHENRLASCRRGSKSSRLTRRFAALSLQRSPTRRAGPSGRRAPRRTILCSRPPVR